MVHVPMGLWITLFFCVIVIALVLFIFGVQAYLSSLENYWLGLILPCTFIFFSTVSSLAFVESGMFWAMLYWNIPTGIMLMIYIVMRRAVKKAKKALEQGEDIPPIQPIMPKKFWKKGHHHDDQNGEISSF